jgi:hypothetical protein
MTKANDLRRGFFYFACLCYSEGVQSTFLHTQSMTVNLPYKWLLEEYTYVRGFQNIQRTVLCF